MHPAPTGHNERVDRHEQPELVERDEELSSLAQSCKEARSEGRFVTIHGAAGLGKTSLLRAAAAIARDSGFKTLSARASELERDLGFGVVRQLFDPLLMSVGEHDRERLFAGTAVLARAALQPDSTDGGAARANDFSPLYGLYWLVANLTREAPVAILLDDVHWADPASRRFVQFLLRRLGDLPVLLVAAWRDGPEGTPHDLLDAASGEHESLRLRPSALTAAAVDALVRRLLGDEVPRGLAEDCHRLTGGNPLLVLAVLRQLAGRAEPAVDDLRWEGPEPLVGSVVARLSSLGSEAASFAEAVAVLSDSCTLSRAARLAGLSEDQAAVSLKRLAAAGVCTSEPLPDFVHPVVRDIVYQHSGYLGASRHARAAEVLRDDGAPAEQVAVQLLFAPSLNGGWVIENLVAAAALAFERGAPESAAALLSRAQTAELPEAQRTELLLSLGIAESRAGSPAALAHLDEARRRSDVPAGRAGAALVQARALYASGEPGQAVELLVGEADAAGHQHPESAGLLIEELRTLGDVDLAVRPLVQAVLERSGSGGPGSTARAAAHDAVALLISGESAAEAEAAAGGALADNTLQRDALAGDPLFFITSFAATCADGFATSEGPLQAAVGAAQHRGDALTYCVAIVQRGFMRARRGDLAEAEADARSALETLELNDWQTLGQMALTVLVYVAIETGELEMVSGQAGLADPALDSGRLSTQGAVLLEARGHLRLAQRDYEGAAADLVRVGEALTGWGVLNPGAFPWRSSAAVALSVVGKSQAARELAEAELVLSRRWGAPRALSISLRTLALHGDRRRQIPLLEEAASLTEGSPALLERAHALVDLGAALRRANRRVDARRHLSEGLALARSCRATPLVTRAHTELWATGARPRTPIRLGADSLTASERRVADMACEGMSNPEIAQALFVSTKTVEMHLTSVFRKLGVTSRVDLPACLRAKTSG